MSTPTLHEYLTKKLEQKRKDHPSFKLMKIDNRLFPNAQTTYSTLVLEARDSSNKPKTVKEIVTESWGKGNKNHLMIEGEGGIGKTVTLLWMPDKFTPFPIPAIYIPLHELDEFITDHDPIASYIQRWVLNTKEELFGQLLDLIEQPWDNGPQLLLLLDGFNEIPADEHEQKNNRKTKRDIIRNNIGHWSEYPGIQIVTSSRYDIHTYVALSYDYSTIKLQPLSDRTVEDYLSSASIPIPIDSAVKKLITIPLLLTLYVKTELIQKQRETNSSSFREVKNAGSIVWNYLQSELWRFRGKQEETKACVLAMEFIAPYIAWKMQQHNDFVLEQGIFLDWTEDAYKLLKEHFGNSAELPRHIKNTVRLTSRHLPEYEFIRDLLKEQLSLFNKQERKDSNNEIIVEYRLMHQQFRDALAAVHLINLIYLSGNSLKEDWGKPVDHYVMQFVADLISEDEATRLWEQNRNTTPAIENATRNLLRLQGMLHNNDFSHLNFNGLDLTDISLYPYRTKDMTVKLPTHSEWMNKTKFADKTFLPEGHKGPINTIALTPNGKRIISGSWDSTIRIWDLETNAPIGKPIEGHERAVNAITLTPDGKCIISGADDNTIRIWDLETGELIGNPIEGHEDSVCAVAVTPDGKHIVSGSYDKTIRVWNLETGKPIGKPIKEHKDWVNAVAITPDGKCIVSGSSDGTICVWDLMTHNQIIKANEGHKSRVSTIAITPDGKHIVSGSEDKTIRVWSLETGEQIGNPIVGNEYWVRAITLTPDGKRIVCGSGDGTIRTWDLETSEPIGKPILGHENGVRSIAVTPDGRRIISGSVDSTIRIWDLETGEPIGKPIEGHKNGTCAVVVTPDGKQIISGSWDSTIHIWDIKTGEPIGKPIKGHKDWVRAVTITPDGKYIISGSEDKTIRVWDLETGRPIGKPLEGHELWVCAVAVTPEGKRIVSGSWDCTIRVWDLKTGKPTGKPIVGHKGAIRAIAVTSDGKHIVSGSKDKTIYIWDLETGKPIGKPIKGHKNYVCTIALTANGKRIVSGSVDSTIRVWDLEIGKQIGQPIIGHKGTVRSVAVTMDGKRIVSGSQDKTIRVWDLETGKQIGKPIVCHKGTVRSVALTPNGKRIVSGADDGTICITDIETRESKTIHIHPLSFVGLNFSLAEISDNELKETLRQNGATV